MKKKLICFGLAIIMLTSLFAAGLSALAADGEIELDNINFPDDAFRNAVKTAFDGDGDGFLSQTEINAVKEINVSGLAISNFKGIEHFTALTGIDCSGTSAERITLPTGNWYMGKKNYGFSDELEGPANTFDFPSDKSGIYIQNSSSSRMTTFHSNDGSEETRILYRAAYCGDVTLSTLGAVFTPPEGKELAGWNLFPNSGSVTTLYSGEEVEDVYAKWQDATTGLDIEQAFPDAAFCEYVADNFDKNSDGVLTDAELSTIEAAKEITVPDGAASLAGIEYFKGVERLNCGSAGLAEIDLSANTELKYVDARGITALEKITLPAETEWYACTGGETYGFGSEVSGEVTMNGGAYLRNLEYSAKVTFYRNHDYEDTESKTLYMIADDTVSLTDVGTVFEAPEGKNFYCWMTEDNAKYMPDDNLEGEDLSLYARWIGELPEGACETEFVSYTPIEDGIYKLTVKVNCREDGCVTLVLAQYGENGQFIEANVRVVDDLIAGNPESVEFIIYNSTGNITDMKVMTLSELESAVPLCEGLPIPMNAE